MKPKGFLCSLLCAAAVAATSRAAPTTRPAASAPAAEASSPARPGADRKDGADDAIPPELIASARNSFVIVETWYKKDRQAVVGEDSMDEYNVDYIYSEYVDQKRPSLSPGVVLDAGGRVLVADDGIDRRFIDKIVVRDLSGRRHPAKRDKLLLAAPGMLLKVSGEGARKLKPLKFHPLTAEGVNTRLLGARLYQLNDQWRIRVGPAFIGPSVACDGSRDKNVIFGYRFSSRMSAGLRHSSGTMTIVSDKAGKCVGVALDTLIDLSQEYGLWKGADLLKAEGISAAKLSESQSAVRKRLAAAMQEVVFTMRQGASAGMLDGRSRYRYHRDRGASGREVSLYGLAVGADLIVVPTTLRREAAAKIERIHVKLSRTKRAAAEFVGAYKDFGAFVVRVTDGKLPAFVPPTKRKKGPEMMRPFWSARMSKRFGEKHVDLVVDRIVGKQRGYGGKYHWRAARRIQRGSLLVDFHGRLAGMVLLQRIEGEETRRLRSADRYSHYGYGSGLEHRIFTIAELAGALSAPRGHLDAKIVVKTSRQAKRRAWLGVEYIGVGRDLAEQLKVQKPTKDGRVGFLVNAVYDDSPARKAGLRVGDILLKLEASGMDEPIELPGAREGGEYGIDSDPWDSYARRSAGPVMAAWKPRRNFLTKALDAIGVGKKVVVTYYRHDEKGHGQMRRLEYTIEQAPPDLDSARKWKNRKLGLTVKDVTYEVRHALNIRGDSPGVIVAKVEHGSPTLVAKIYPNEIITRLDEEPLTSARQMRDLVAAARKAGRAKVRLTVLQLGKTRFADLAIKNYDPEDDEGLDEE